MIACHGPAFAQPAPSATASGPDGNAGVESSIAAPSVPPSAAAAAIRRHATAEIREEDLLLLSVDLDGLTVTDALPAYGDPGDPLLPLGELARLLDLNLTVSAADGQVVGRLGEAERPLTLDLASGVYRLNGAGVTLAPDDLAATGVDIYLKASALQRLLPVTFTADSEALQLKLHAIEKLPIQARLDRLAQLRALQPDTDQAEPSLRTPSPYLLFSMPSLDIQGQIGASQIPPRFPHTYDVRLGGDLFYTGFQGYVGSDQNGRISSVRATFERHDVNGGLLGPINATSASAGDVFTPSLALGVRSVTGRGFQFSNAPLEQTSVFNRIDLRGELPVGYDVQLYINDILRSGQRTPVNGRYEFLNVPLVRGVNVIRIVTNGPRGERSEQTRIVNVGGGQLPKGKFTLELGAVQQDTSLFDVGAPDDLDPNNQAFPGRGSLRFAADAAYGLTSQMTLVAGAAAFPAATSRLASGGLRTEERGLATAGLRTSILGAALQLDGAVDSNRGSALAVGLAAQPFGVSTVGRQVFYRGGFIDETVGSGTADKPIVSHSEINMDFNVRPYKDALVPLTLRGTRDLFADRSSTTSAGFRASATARNVLLSGGVDLNANAAPGLPVSYFTTGNLSASTFYQFKWQLRASLDYTIMPTPGLNALTITADRDLSPVQSLRLGLGRNLARGGDTNFQIGDTLRTRYGDLMLSGNYAAPSNQWQIGLSFAMGLVFDPLAKRYRLTRPGVAQGGSAVFQAFIDRDGDGVYGDGDTPAPGVAVDGGERKGTTDARGQALVTGLGSAPTGRLQVSLDAVEDPYVTSPPHTITFAPRPGRVLTVPYPMSPSSEVIVRVVLQQPDRKVGLSAVRVRLVKKGAPALEASTEFDGSVGFDQLSVGTYQLELDREQAERLHMRLLAPVQIAAPPAGGPLPDVTATVVFDRTASAADSTPGG